MEGEPGWVSDDDIEAAVLDNLGKMDIEAEPRGECVVGLPALELFFVSFQGVGLFLLREGKAREDIIEERFGRSLDLGLFLCTGCKKPGNHLNRHLSSLLVDVSGDFSFSGTCGSFVLFFEFEEGVSIWE